MDLILEMTRGTPRDSSPRPTSLFRINTIIMERLNTYGTPWKPSEWIKIWDRAPRTYLHRQTKAPTNVSLSPLVLSVMPPFWLTSIPENSKSYIWWLLIFQPLLSFVFYDLTKNNMLSPPAREVLGLGIKVTPACFHLLPKIKTLNPFKTYCILFC